MRLPGADAGRRRSAPARSATSSPGSRTSARPRSARRVTDRRAPAPSRSTGYRDPKPMVFCGLYPGRRRRVRRPARGAREAAAQRLVVHLRARDVGRARLRVPLRLPRPAAHGDRPRAARARVRPRRSSPPRRTSSTGVELDRRHASRSSTTRRRCRRRTRSTRSRSRTSRSRSSRRPSTSARSWSSAQQRRGEMQKMEYLSEERVELVYTLPLGRDRHGLLRPDEVAHQGLRAPRLRARRATARRTSSKVDVLLNNVPVDAFSTIVHRDKAYDYGQAHDREAARAHPAPAVRRADPGRDRRPHHRPRDGEGEAQGRASPSATAVTSRASASCSSARRRARSA